jgi:hemolysin-activating ACP:hemolysin acyltransferase
MRKNFFAVFSEPNDANKEKAFLLGFAAKLVMSSPFHRSLPIEYLNQVVKPALTHKQIKFYFNARGEPVGYVVWAFVAPDVEERFAQGHKSMHISEWNEGSALWIVDLLAPYGNIKEILCDLRDTVFIQHQTVRYARFKRGKVLCKELCRRDLCYFFSQTKRNAA